MTKSPEFKKALLGHTDTGVPVYSAELIIEELAKEMPLDEAAEYFDYNFACAYLGEMTPIYVWSTCVEDD